MNLSRPTIVKLTKKISNASIKRPVIKLTDNTDFSHVCTLKSITFDELLGNKPKWIRNTIISETHTQTSRYFTSSYMVEEEIKRHVNGPYWYIIHPMSKFNVLWEQIMFVVYIINWFVVLFQIAYHEDLTSTSAYINFAIQWPCYIDIVLRFFMGYCSHYDIILDQQTISCHYLKTWFLSDLITSIPFQAVEYFFPNRLDKLTLNIVILYQTLKIVTFRRIRMYFKNTVAFWNIGYLTYMILALVLVSLLCFHVSAIVFQIGANISKLTILNDAHPLNNVDKIGVPQRFSIFWFRYLLCQYITALNFYSFTFAYSSFIDQATNLPLILNSLLIIQAYLYQLYAVVKVIQIFQFRHNSKIKYQEIMNQLERYMRTKHLPLEIKKSLIEFYEQRYQYRFFKEKSINDNLSDSLRRQLIFHCGQLFMKNIPIFKNIPKKVLAKIVSCLKPEIYMPNDLIIKAGTVGDCMYFIASGTVSIRTTTGQELQHLEDGEHFGEISLFSKVGKRVSNIVAIEHCELYRLDKSDYEANIAIIPELAEKFETIAMQRMNATSTVEERYKKERKKQYMIDDKRGGGPPQDRLTIR